MQRREIYRIIKRKYQEDGRVDQLIVEPYLFQAIEEIIETTRKNVFDDSHKKKKDVLETSFKKLDEYLSSEEGQNDLKEYADNLKKEQEKLDSVLIKMNELFSSTPSAFDSYINETVRENEAKRKYCDEHSNGYELITEGKYKGEHSEVSPTKSFYDLFEYFRKFGPAYLGDDKDDEMFLSESYIIGEYYMEIHQGQGCIYRLYKVKDNELLIQI